MKYSPLIGKMIAAALIFFFFNSSFSQEPTQTDFSPDGMLVQKIPSPPSSTDSFFDIWPEVSISTNNPDEMPLHADLYVNDILVGQDQIHIVQLAGGGCPADCFASCQLDVWHPGAPPVMYGGNCVTLTPSGCKCQTGPIEMWPIQGIPLQPGDVIRLVIDPQNLVPEIDETNNEIVHIYNNQTDFSNESGEFWFDNLQPGLANITPIVNIGTNSQLSLPLHADLYINGVLFAEDRMHRVKTAGGQCLGDSCVFNSCQIDIWHPGGTVVMHQGVCNPLTPSGCYCYVKHKKLWPFTGVPLNDGDIIRIILDPLNEVEELDETNNEIVLKYGDKHQLKPVDIEIVALDLGGFSVQPIVDIGSNSELSMPVEADLFVNGSLVAQDRMHLFETAPGQCPPSACIGSCQYIIWHPGGSKTPENGLCVQLTPEGCFCSKAGAELWPFPGALPLLPGDELMLILDPDGKVPEIDETDNILTMTFDPDVCICCSTNPTMPKPVDLSKSFAPVPWPNGVQDRVQVKWYKDQPKIRLQPEDNAACEIQFWKVRDLITGQVFVDPDTVTIPKENVQKPGNELFKWPIKFRADGANNAKRVDPNIRYKWRVRCYCEAGEGVAGPWSDVKIFNTPDFDPSTGIFDPPLPPSINQTKLSEFTDDISIYPNPSDGSFSVLIESSSDKPLDLIIHDLTGRVVEFESTRMKSDKMEYQVNVSGIPNGMYIISGSIDNELIMRSVIMIE